jgi:uncharacterized RDD family membrane protein YckC
MPKDSEQIDSTIDIVTPENIAFHYRVAGPFRRVPAYLIDFAIRIAILVAISMFMFFAVVVPGAAILTFVVIVLAHFVLEWFYGGLFETFMNGQTPGKWIMGIRVLTVDGQPINGMQAILRNILRFADMMPMVSLQIFGGPPAYLLPTFMLAMVAMAMNRRYQRLGDLVCGTMVVIEERSWLMGVTRIDDPRAAQLAEYLPLKYEVSRSLARTLATYVERRRFFSAARRREIARHLGEPLLREFGLPPDTSHDLVLCALYYRTFIADRAEDRQETAPGVNPFAVGSGLPFELSNVTPLPRS